MSLGICCWRSWLAAAGQLRDTSCSEAAPWLLLIGAGSVGIVEYLKLEETCKDRWVQLPKKSGFFQPHSTAEAYSAHRSFQGRWRHWLPVSWGSPYRGVKDSNICCGFSFFSWSWGEEDAIVPSRLWREGEGEILCSLVTLLCSSQELW